MGMTRKDGRRRKSRPRKAQIKRPKPCRKCKKPFTAKHTATLYCSEECRLAFIAQEKAAKKDRFVIPELVINEMQPQYADHSQAYLESQDRKNAAKRKKRADALAVPIICKREDCGVEFVREVRQQKFCSFECQPLQQERIKTAETEASKRNKPAETVPLQLEAPEVANK